ncbi:MAG TPA: hypothetical protein VFL83_23100 [Anaeromyxobacter sp.]|nr:hypothetical protein [Anaeromyxobacter sp.]
MKEASVECTHCRVVMTSWSAPGSPIRYFQCPFCQRTHSSLYGEVFRRRAGARVVEAPARASAPQAIPMATPEEMHWARVKQTASRWFARLEADERRCAASGGGPVRAANAPRSAPGDDVPEPVADDVIELVRVVPAGRGR